MKKILLALSILFCLSLFVYGQDSEYNDTETEAEDAEKTSAFKFPSWMTREGAALSTGRRESRSRFELGLLDLTFSGVLDGVDLFGGLSFDPAKIKALNVDLDIMTNPLYVKIPVRDIFVLDAFIRADVDVRVNLSEGAVNALKDIESLASADITKLPGYIDGLENIKGGMSAGASAFTEFGLGGSKTLLDDRLWVRAAPSLYFTLFYMKHSSVNMQGYNDIDKTGQAGLKANGSLNLYSAWDLKNGAVNPFASPGLDITLEGRYALWPVLDLGLSVSHIPIIPSTLTHRMTVNVNDLSMFIDVGNLQNINFDAPDLDEMITSGDNEPQTVMRPARFDLYGLVKPFKSPLLIVQPNIGATVNTVFADAAFNWGLTVWYNAPRIFSAFIGSGLTEGVWAQRLGIALDFRVFELDLTAALAGATFAGSWSANGFIAGIGFKFGL